MPSPSALLSSPAPELIAKLELEEHFEGGFFKQTEAIQVGKWGAARKARGLISWSGDDLKATQIYYLLSAKSQRGKMHMNLNHVS